MSLRDNNEFSPVTSTKERALVFEMMDLGQSRFRGTDSALTGFASDLQDPESWTEPFTFDWIDRSGEALTLEIRVGSQGVLSRELKVGEIVEIFFGLEDGKYLLRAEIEKVEQVRVSIRTGAELLRLQRRNNFRVTLPFDSRIRFLLNEASGKKFKKIELTAIDLSAGGIRLRWPATELPLLKVGDRISGLLTTGGKQMDLKAIARAVSSPHGLTEIGFEFQEMAQKDEQALMFLCLQIYRSKNGGVIA